MDETKNQAPIEVNAEEAAVYVQEYFAKNGKHYTVEEIDHIIDIYYDYLGLIGLVTEEGGDWSNG